MQYFQCIQGGWEELGCQRCWQPSFFVQRKSRGVSETRSPCPRRGRGNSRPSKEGGEEDQLHPKYFMSDDGSNLIRQLEGTARPRRCWISRASSWCPSLSDLESHVKLERFRLSVVRMLKGHHGFRDGESTLSSDLARFYWDPDLLSAAWLREAAVLDALVPGRLCTVIYLAISMFRFLV